MGIKEALKKAMKDAPASGLPIDAEGHEIKRTRDDGVGVLDEPYRHDDGPRPITQPAYRWVTLSAMCDELEREARDSHGSHGDRQLMRDVVTFIRSGMPSGPSTTSHTD